MAENRSTVLKVFNFGYKFCLIAGVALLLIAYRDVGYKEHALSNEVASLQAKFQGDTKLRRRRSLGLDSLFKELNRRIDSLERRLVFVVYFQGKIVQCCCIPYFHKHRQRKTLNWGGAVKFLSE